MSSYTYAVQYSIPHWVISLSSHSVDSVCCLSGTKSINCPLSHTHIQFTISISISLIQLTLTSRLQIQCTISMLKIKFTLPTYVCTIGSLSPSLTHSHHCPHNTHFLSFFLISLTHPLWSSPSHSYIYFTVTHLTHTFTLFSPNSVTFTSFTPSHSHIHFNHPISLTYSLYLPHLTHAFPLLLISLK